MIVRVPSRIGQVADVDPADPLPPLCGIVSCEGERPAVRVRFDRQPSGRRQLFYACQWHAYALEDDFWLRKVTFVPADSA